MVFYLFRYDFRFPRYHRVKKKVIFNRLLSPSLSLIRTSYSHFVLLTYSKVQTSDRRDSWKNVVHISKKKRRSGSIHNISLRCLKYYENFQSLYLSNRLRYRDKSKSEFNGMVSSIFRVDFKAKTFSRRKIFHL